MARQTRSQEEVDRVKNHIIEGAMKLILEEGFNNMSLRKLARTVGMSPTNIYYYYAGGKDEIYLNIQIKGFKLLQTALESVNISETDPVESLKRMIRAYLEFGFTNPDYYQIMLNSDTPRYLEYKKNNSPMEPVALMAKQAAVSTISVPLNLIEVISRTQGLVPKTDIDYRAYQLWITLHGIVTLNNKNILKELDEMVPTSLIDRMCDDLLHPFSPIPA